jgi:hypothetical protein
VSRSYRTVVYAQSPSRKYYRTKRHLTDKYLRQHITLKIHNGKEYNKFNGNNQDSDWWTYDIFCTYFSHKELLNHIIASRESDIKYEMMFHQKMSYEEAKCSNWIKKEFKPHYIMQRYYYFISK